MTHEPGTLVTLATYSSALEAEMAVGLLSDAGIGAMARGNDIVGIFGPGFQGATSLGVEVLVASENYDRAVQLIQDFDAGEEEDRE
ncbi:MAG: DUF2007 domain-containing protein [Gemmatimonadaceae bacterium]